MLVTEPTPFGLHDLALAVEMVRELDIPWKVQKISTNKFPYQKKMEFQPFHSEYLPLSQGDIHHFTSIHLNT
jgi:MinD superfamily P-loop ATPase